MALALECVHFPLVSVLDPKAVLAEQARRGMPSGAVAAITISSVCLAGFLGLLLLAGSGSFLVAMLLSMVTLVPMMAGVMAIDRLEPEPRYLLVTVFLWGAGASVVLSVIFEVIGGVTLVVAGAASDTWLAVVVAPVVEESMKGLALFGLLWFARGQVNGITDGVVYAATTALGFAAAENIEYYIAAALEGGAHELGITFLLRGVMSPFCHPVFTSMTGIAIGLAVRQRGAARILLPIGGLLAAMVLHGTWNGLAGLDLGGVVAAMAIVICVLVGIFVAIHADWKKTIAQIETCMAAYLPSGLVTGRDLAMLSTMGLRKQARDWARDTHGKTGFDAMRDYQVACTRLTMLHDRAAVGTIDPYRFAQQRWALLTLMRFAREAFLGPAHATRPMFYAPAAPVLTPTPPPIPTYAPPA